MSFTPICSYLQLQPKPRRPCVTGEKWPIEQFTRADAKDTRRLQGRVHRLETLVHDLCSVIVYCDDMALMEREILQSGDIYMDLSSTKIRKPLLLRRAIADLARQYGDPVGPPAHKWHTTQVE